MSTMGNGEGYSEFLHISNNKNIHKLILKLACT